MITSTQARNLLDAFTWTDGNQFLEAYNKVYGEHVTYTWNSYIEHQFRLMQNDPLAFVIKWENLAAQICVIYEATR